MPRYRVRVVIEESDNMFGSYKELEQYNYRSANSDWFEIMRHLYTSLTQVAFYWNVVDKRGERQ